MQPTGRTCPELRSGAASLGAAAERKFVRAGVLPARAQVAPAGCLDTATTQGDMTVCSGEAPKAVDQQLRQLVGELRRKLEPGQRAQLDSTQALWSRYAVVACRLEASPHMDGSMYHMVVTLCRRRLAEQRLRELAPLLCQYSAATDGVCPEAERYGIKAPDSTVR